MNIALPILLLVFGGLTLWILTESSLRWYIKTVCISVFCVFTVIFWSTIHTFLGWPADENDMPKKILIHWIIIKEPNKFTKSDGAIYVLLESAGEIKANRISRFFGHKNKMEPRLYGLSYSRGLHERLEKEVIPKLKRGQPVAGKLIKGGQGGGDKKEEGSKSAKKGGGSESQEQEWHFHELRPSEIHSKPER